MSIFLSPTSPASTLCRVCNLITWDAHRFKGCCANCPLPPKKDKKEFCVNCVEIFPTALLTLYGGKCKKCYHNHLRSVL